MAPHDPDTPVTPHAPTRPTGAALSPVAVSLALAVVTGAVFLGELASDARPSPAALVLDAAVGLAACAAYPRALSRPGRLVVVLVALSALVPTVTPVAATAVFELARRAPLRRAVVAGVAGVAAQLVRGTLRPLAGVPLGWWSLVMVVGFAAVVGWGAWMQAHRALVESLAERARRLEDERDAQVVEARRAERTRIAREMHDVLAHRLSVLATISGAIAYHPDAPADDLARSVEAIRSTAHLALEDLRQVIGVLRSDDDEEPELPGAGPDRPQPTLAEVSALVEEWRRTGAAVDLVDTLSSQDRDGVPPGLGRTVYRIVQEALTNAHKHAPGQPVCVDLQGSRGGSLRVAVVNPLPAEPRTGVPGSRTGLVGLAERVELAGGDFDAGSTPAREHRVSASLPWPG